MAVSKRAVVLRLAELERYPTLKARYEITLPFNNVKDAFQDDVRCNCPGYDGGWEYKLACDGSCDDSISFAKRKAEAIKQTGKRWVWFSEARRLDDRLGRRLGTLGYLPFEIREMIWCAVIEDYLQSGLRKHYNELWDNQDSTRLKSPLDFGTYLWDSPREHGVGEIFDLDSYDWRSPIDEGVMSLRFVSPQAKIELENAFISIHDFRFTSPERLEDFLSQLSACQRLLLRSITLKLSVPAYGWVHLREPTESEYRAWQAVIEHLPATLRSVIFQLGCPRFHPDMRIRGLEEYVAVLEVLAKKVQRQAPRAKISVAPMHHRCDEDREIVQSMLDELVPYSEDFIRWSEQARKSAMDEGKAW